MGKYTDKDLKENRDFPSPFVVSKTRDGLNISATGCYYTPGKYDSKGSVDPQILEELDEYGFWGEPNHSVHCKQPTDGYAMVEVICGMLIRIPPFMSVSE